MTYDEFKKERLGKRYKENDILWYQCVALVKLFCRYVHNIKLKNFWGSALVGRETGSPFVWMPYARIKYENGLYPPRWAIVFFDKTDKNKSWHVAIAGRSYPDKLYVVEQNAGNGNGDWLGQNAIKVTNRKYKWEVVWDCLWRFIHHHQY